ncbi:MAG: hypothetical protein QOK15_216 [Nocardioidaceae bacterium]|nr:hypothetical protein [Nocardioidaceae bacterium]
MRGHFSTRALIAACSVVVLMTVAVLVIVQVRSGSGPGGGSPGPSQLPAPSGLKAPLQGLVLQQDRPLTDADAGVYGGQVLTTTWAALQPHGPGTLARHNAIDRGLRAVAAFNDQHPDTPVGIRLRILAGIHAPRWVKRLDGFQPVPVTNMQDVAGGTLGAFWSAGYMRAYADLQRLLAARYDDAPLLLDVVISGCMTIYAEPLQRDISGFDALFRAGYTTQADRTCLLRQVDAHDVWQHTHQSLALNPYRPWVQGSGGPTQAATDLSVTSTVASYCRSKLGQRCTLSNNSIRSAYAGYLTGDTDQSTGEPPYAALYRVLRTEGPPMSFQCAAPSRVGDIEAAIQAAVQAGANAVEVPVAYDPDAMRRDNTALLDNPTS